MSIKGGGRRTRLNHTVNFESIDLAVKIRWFDHNHVKPHIEPWSLMKIRWFYQVRGRRTRLNHRVNIVLLWFPALLHWNQLIKHLKMVTHHHRSKDVLSYYCVIGQLSINNEIICSTPLAPTLSGFEINPSGKSLCIIVLLYLKQTNKHVTTTWFVIMKGKCFSEGLFQRQIKLDRFRIYIPLLFTKKHAKKIKVLCAKFCVTNMDLSFMVFTVFGRI